MITKVRINGIDSGTNFINYAVFGKENGDSYIGNGKGLIHNINSKEFIFVDTTKIPSKEALEKKAFRSVSYTKVST